MHFDKNNAIKSSNEGAKKAPSSTTFFQPKLTINEPGDKYEQEADAMADRVMRMPMNDQSFFSPKPVSFSHVQRKCAHCEEEENKMQRKEINNDATVADTSTENYINSLNGKGRSLTQQERKFFEQRIGYDFSNVQLHTNSEANQSAKNVNALAYTHGNHIAFAAGKYQSNTDSGRRLIAHELTHVVQQSGADGLNVGQSNDKRGLSLIAQQSRAGGVALHIGSGNAASILQRQPAQTGDSLAPTSDPQDIRFEELPHAPSYRVRVVAHASPRWREATDAKEGDQLNLDLSKKRADEVGREVEKLLAKHLPTGSTVSVQTSADLQENTVGVEEEAHGSRDTLVEAHGNRADNAQGRRRVDVYISSDQVVTGSGGASRPLLRRPTASKFWHVSVDLTAGGSAGAAGYLLALTLTNDNTGETMQGKVWSLGGGPKASIGASYSVGDSTGFMTQEPMDFEDFEGEWVTYASGGVSAFVGYSWSYIIFRGLNTVPKDIDVSGASVGTVGIGGAVTSGKFHFDGAFLTYPPTSIPIENTDETEIAYTRTEHGEDKYQVLFATGNYNISPVESDLLDSFVASVVAARK